MPEKYFRPAEIAKILNVEYDVIAKLIRNHRLEVFPNACRRLAGWGWLIHEKDVELARNKIESYK